MWNALLLLKPLPWLLATYLIAFLIRFFSLSLSFTEWMTIFHFMPYSCIILSDYSKIGGDFCNILTSQFLMFSSLLFFIPSVKYPRHSYHPGLAHLLIFNPKFQLLSTISFHCIPPSIPFLCLRWDLPHLDLLIFLLCLLLPSSAFLLSADILVYYSRSFQYL